MKCCVVGCNESALFEIVDLGDKSDANTTQACHDPEHLGLLTGCSRVGVKPDGPWMVRKLTFWEIE